MIEFLKSPALSGVVILVILFFVWYTTLRRRVTKQEYRAPYASVVSAGLLMVTGNITKLEEAVTSPIIHIERLEEDVYYIRLNTSNIEITKEVAKQINSMED